MQIQFLERAHNTSFNFFIQQKSSFKKRCVLFLNNWNDACTFQLFNVPCEWGGFVVLLSPSISLVSHCAFEWPYPHSLSLSLALCVCLCLRPLTHTCTQRMWYVWFWKEILYGAPISHVSKLFHITIRSWRILKFTVSVLTWHGSVWDTQLGVPRNQLGISPGLSGITQGWRGISSDYLFQGREDHRLAKLPLTKQEVNATTPAVGPPAAKAILGCWI